MTRRTRAEFETEAALCARFLSLLQEEWTAYPEHGFDILLVRKSDGFQIGIEAKLTLNAKVIEQISEGFWDVCRAGPDCRAVLVPWGAAGSFRGVCDLLAITVIEVDNQDRWGASNGAVMRPALPSLGSTRYWEDNQWHEWAPDERIKLPDYVPDVAAGSASPVKLTQWKIGAIKICVLLEKRGQVTRQDFKFLQIDHRRWINPMIQWLQHGDKAGSYVPGPYLPDLRTQHPKNYAEIAADFARWAPPEYRPATQGAML